MTGTVTNSTRKTLGARARKNVRMWACVMIKFIFIAYSFLKAAYTYLTEFTRDFLRLVGCHCFLKISAYACNQANGSTGIDHADSAMLRLRVASTAHQPRRQRAYGSHEYIVYVREGWTYAPLSHDLFFSFPPPYDFTVNSIPHFISFFICKDPQSPGCLLQIRTPHRLLHFVPEFKW